MFISKIVFDRTHPRIQRALNDCDKMHRFLMWFFGTDGSNRAGFDVLYRIESESYLVMQSVVPPDPNKTTEGLRIAAVKDVSAFYQEVKAGDIMRFVLDGNAFRPDKATGKRVGMKAPRESIRWLLGRAQVAGFELGLRPGEFPVGMIPHLVRGMKQNPSDPKDTMPITLQGVRFEGILRVVDELRFQKGLIHGVGQGKSYGLGLLSIALIVNPLIFIPVDGVEYGFVPRHHERVDVAPAVDRESSFL